MTGNAGYRLDVWLLGENHLYHGEGVAFDPEGILSTLPAVVNVIAGYFTGVFVSRKGKTYEGLTQLLLWGTALIAVCMRLESCFPYQQETVDQLLCPADRRDRPGPVVLSDLLHRAKGKNALDPFLFGLRQESPVHLSPLGAVYHYPVHYPGRQWREQRRMDQSRSLSGCLSRTIRLPAVCAGLYAFLLEHW